MIYLIGGAPRAGKTILGQQMAAKLGIGWVSTDLIVESLRAAQVGGVPSEWDASPAAITATAVWFYPILERFVWAVTGVADHYVIEGVSFLPAHVQRLAQTYPVRAIFLGCSGMTIARFDAFPGKSKGYAVLPEAMRRRFADDVPAWSDFIRTEAAHHGCDYIDMTDDFPARLRQAENVLLSSVSTAKQT